MWGVPASSFIVFHTQTTCMACWELYTPSPITLLRRVLIHFVGSFLNIVHFHIQVKSHMSYTSEREVSYALGWDWLCGLNAKKQRAGKSIAS